MSTKKKTLPIVLRHYDVPGDADGSFRAEYKHCGTIISGSTKATSNFWTHLKVQLLQYALKKLWWLFMTLFYFTAKA